MHPFDYVELDSGDLACVMWLNATCNETVAYPWYRRDTTDCLVIDGRPVTKIYRKGLREPLDEHTRTLYPADATMDPIGGLMVRLSRATVRRHFDGAVHLKEVWDSRHPINIQPLFDLLRLSPDTAGTTGTWLLGADHPSDLDIVVRDANAGSKTATVIEQVLREETVQRLPGYWGRPYHHRRFMFEGWKVCVRCSAPPEMTRSFTLGSSYLGEAGDFRCLVVDAELGHCTPSLYWVRFESDGALWSTGETLPLVSSDGSHAFAFKNGDVLRVHYCRVYSSLEHPRFLACHLGSSEAIRPAQERR